MIEKTKGGYAVTSKTGKKLGSHKTKEGAKKQLGAIEAYKSARKSRGYR